MMTIRWTIVEAPGSRHFSQSPVDSSRKLDSSKEDKKDSRGQEQEAKNKQASRRKRSFVEIGYRRDRGMKVGRDGVEREVLKIMTDC